MYYLNQQHASCKRTQIDFISVNIYQYVQYSLSNSAITSCISMQIYSSSTEYKNSVSMSIVWESHLLINHISIMTHGVTSVNIGKQFQVKSTPGIWVYPHTTRCALNWPSLFFLNTHFDSIRHIFGGIFLLLDFLHTPLFIMSLNLFRIFYSRYL